MTIVRRVGVALALVLLAVLAMAGRAAFVQRFFVDGTPGIAPPLTPAPTDAAGLPASARVRVVLLDGLSAAHADTLPNLDALCGAGLDLRVDTGFPTVSLPVQHVLWTGRTQAQSGMWFRIPRLSQAPADALPRLVPGSVGMAESHEEIVGSFGFASEGSGSISPPEFLAEALAAVASPARLVFVHVLRIDEAGHAFGAASEAYASAAASADAWLGELRAGAGADAVWLVLADHGHRPGGGHGGAEAGIRVVRACVAGPGIEAADHRGGEPIHLVDLHRGLAQLLGLPDRPASAGRSIAFALEHPDPGATLPRPSLGLLLGGLALALAGLLATARGAGRRVRAWPWWWLVAYASIVAFEGWPTLSNPMIYPSNAAAMLRAALPGVLVLAPAAWVGLRREGLGATLLAAGALPLAGLLACLVICGVLFEGPPLVPGWTAHASVGFGLVALGSAVLAVLVALGPRSTAGR